MPRPAQPSAPPAPHHKLQLVFTLDYEIHGNGEGSPQELMVARTDRLLDVLQEVGAKLTIMADAVEILKFKEHREATGRDDYGYEAIENQLKSAIARGHDVQLHLHTAYAHAHAHASERRWVLDYRDYDLAHLGYDRIYSFVKQGKDYLEGLLRPVRPGYTCDAFRSANWSMSPSRDIVRALVANGIRIDTSVFKYGHRHGLVSFDYSHAESDTEPWPVDELDVCRRDDGGKLFELPIYCELRPIWSFLSLNRVNNAVQNVVHPLPESAMEDGARDAPATGATGKTGRASLLQRGAGLIGALRGQHARKLDFNQCSGRQMIATLRRAAEHHAHPPRDLPIVLIGHSKLFTGHNERQLRRFLRYVASRPDLYGFSTLGGFDVETFRKAAPVPTLQRAEA